MNKIANTNIKVLIGLLLYIFGLGTVVLNQIQLKTEVRSLEARSDQVVRVVTPTITASPSAVLSPTKTAKMILVPSGTARISPRVSVSPIVK